MREISPRLGLRYKTNKSSKRGFLFHVPPNDPKTNQGRRTTHKNQGEIRVSIPWNEKFVPSVV